MSQNAWYEAHNSILVKLVEIVQPLWDPATLTLGDGAFSNMVPAKTKILSFLSGGSGDTSHVSSSAELPPDGNWSWRVPAIVFARFPYDRQTDGTSKGEKDAMAVASLVLDNLPVLQQQNADNLYPTAHPDVDPVWRRLANADTDTLHWELTIPLEMVYTSVST